MISLKLMTQDGHVVSNKDLIKQWKFPCGEAGIQLSQQALSLIDQGWQAVVVLDYQSNDDLFALGQAVDALRQAYCQYVGLTMRYVPYSRQDRRCNPGEGHALKVFANYINSLGFDNVVAHDSHSSVCEALFNNFHDIPQEECAKNLPKFDVLIAPDAGAEKKVFKHRQVKEGTKVVCATKVRDSNGKITSVYVPSWTSIVGKDVCIIDDLCDGGATFLELGKVVKGFDPKSMSLYITHGMFTNPDKFVELNDLYDRIYVHNLWNDKYGSYIETV